MTPKAPFSATSVIVGFPSHSFKPRRNPPVTLRRRKPQGASDRQTIQVTNLKEGVATADSEDVKHAQINLNVVSNLISRHDYIGTCRAVYDGIPLGLKFVVSPERDPTPVFKLAMEAELYENQLASVQGEAVPHYYGYFEGKDEEDWNVGCIILEDCGDAVEGPFSDLPMPDRAKILMALGKVHQRGVSPMDFCESNVVHANGDFRIIDFNDVYLKHVCGWTGDLFPGEELPAPREIGCGVIYDFGTEMELWEINYEWYSQLK